MSVRCSALVSSSAWITGLQQKGTKVLDIGALGALGVLDLVRAQAKPSPRPRLTEGTRRGRGSNGNQPIEVMCMRAHAIRIRTHDRRPRKSMKERGFFVRRLMEMLGWFVSH